MKKESKSEEYLPIEDLNEMIAKYVIRMRNDVIRGNPQKLTEENIRKIIDTLAGTSGYMLQSLLQLEIIAESFSKAVKGIETPTVNDIEFFEKVHSQIRNISRSLMDIDVKKYE